MAKVSPTLKISSPIPSLGKFGFSKPLIIEEDKEREVWSHQEETIPPKELSTKESSFQETQQETHKEEQTMEASGTSSPHIQEKEIDKDATIMEHHDKEGKPLIEISDNRENQREKEDQESLEEK